MQLKTKLQFLFFISLYSLASFSQGSTANDSLVKNLKISAFPVAFYTPETAFGFGGLGIGNFWLRGESKETRPSSIQLGLSYTTKNQYT